MCLSKKGNFALLMILFLNCTQSAYASTVYKVKPSDTVDKITKTFYKGGNLSRHQIYIGILAENPTAFALGNINYLKIGQTLNLPGAAELLAMEKQDATKLVARHNFNANKGNKAKMPSPFEGYTPKSQAVVSDDINALAKKQQAVSNNLERLNSESDALRDRLSQLTADQEAMDAEINQLDSLLK